MNDAFSSRKALNDERTQYVYSYNPNRKGISEVQILKLETFRLYPPASHLEDAFLRRPKREGFRIDRSTPIASIGSCFAREIKYWLKDNGYNYLQVTNGPCTEAGSARYDRVYNTFSIRQEVERAFGQFEPLCSLWRFREDGRERLLDPHRHCVAWDDDNDMKRELEEHRIAVHQAFTQAKVIIITVGQAEVWYDKRDGVVFPMAPPTKVFDREIHDFRVSTFGENLDNLKAIYRLIKAHNPDAQLVITVSPVPLRATFRAANSIEANCASKSMLRAAVDEFVRSHGSDVSYFPAYEIVTCTHKEPFEADARHVQSATVESIMALFEHRFLKQGERVSDEQLVHLGNEAMAAGDWTDAAGHFEDLLSRIDAHLPSGSHPLSGCVNQMHQVLGEAYMKLERYAAAYEVLKRALALTDHGTPRYYHLLNQVAALAIDHFDLDGIDEIMNLILTDEKAPVDMFLHYVMVLESWYDKESAAKVLVEGNLVNMNLRSHKDYPQLACHLGVESNATPLQTTTPMDQRTDSDSLPK